jgi:tRNA-splicing ligase RtcB (3'-phosphate/5'-hydroxy nucleic acid ligase)
MIEVIYEKGKHAIPIFNWCSNLEERAKEQAEALANHPAVFHHVALMPDAHAGMGMPIGGVAAFDGVVVPNAVGVDIGCGVLASPLYMKIKDLEPLFPDICKYIREEIPIGFAHQHPNRVKSWLSGKDTWGQIYQQSNLIAWKSELYPPFPYEDTYYGKNSDDMQDFIGLTDANILSQLGTLGGGNHYIEFDADESGSAWINIHSGSRNIGYKIAQYFNNVALKLNAKWHSKTAGGELAFLPVDSPEGQSYLTFMKFALDFAYDNRRFMLDRVKVAMNKAGISKTPVSDIVNIHHNYAVQEHHYGRNVWVHRKGATLARKDTTGIIPGSMGTCTYIVKGLGNPESFDSCSHGAGRRMSRTAAKKEISQEDMLLATKGILISGGRLDEAPQVYKDIDEVMENQKDLVKSVITLKPKVVIKG